MAWTPSAVALVVFGSGVIAVAVGGFALRERPDPMASPVAVLMIGVVTWSIPHAIALGFTDLEAVVFWSRIQYPGTAVAPVAYLVVALRYAGYEAWLSRRTYAALGVIPAITTIVAWTNPAHGLFWASVAVTRIGDVSVLDPVYGPWYWVSLAYLYLVTAAGILVFAKVIVESGRLYRKQAGLMLVGALVPLATNAAETVGFLPDSVVDLTTIALTVTGVTFALALFRFDLTNVRPVARDHLLEELDDGVVVVGPDGRIRDFNPTAERVLGDIAVDQDADEVLPSAVAPDGDELVVETNGEKRRFRTRSTTFEDESGREAGRIVYLNDITEIAVREQRISVLNRILRHNLRNELNVATGHLELAEAEASEPATEHVERAMESTERVIEFAEKARQVQRALTESDREVAVDLAALLERVAERTREQFPEADIAVEDPNDGLLEATVINEDLFERALAELVENAVVHSDHDAPSVVVSARAASDGVAVSVADDGPGIPESETAVLTAGRETQLEHASGLGLWLVRWTASLSAGKLSFEENEPRGSVVTLRLPAGGGN
jgi:signal transduction histidine kinase